jgi:ABC-type transport system involved in multi-copper enzyme maturation permease subunit
MFGGPVLFFELLLGSRRNRLWVFRYIYAAWLLVQFFVLYLLYLIEAYADSNSTGRFAVDYVTMFIWQQLILLTIATPALVAGAVTDEKERGTLQYLLTAELLPVEIVVGKLVGRLAGVLSIFLAGLPFLCFVGSFTSIGLVGILVVILELALAAFALAAASMLASVWARQTRDAVLSLFAVGVIAWVVGLAARVTVSRATLAGTPKSMGLDVLRAVASLAEAFDPAWVLEPALAGDDTRALFVRLFWHALVWGSVATVCATLAILRLRAAYVKQLEGSGKRKRQLLWSARPNVNNEPITWKERFVVGLAPLPWFRYVPRWLGLCLIVFFTLLAGLTVLGAAASVAPWEYVAAIGTGQFGRLTIDKAMAGEAFAGLGIAVVVLASMIVGIRCSGAITGEREKHTWEALLLTPLSTPQLVRAKLWGVIGSTYPYLTAFAVPMLFCMLLADPLLLIFLAVLLVVTWLAMFYAGASGLWCSARSKSSWRSLLGTMGWAYLGGAVMFAVLSPLLFFVYLFISVIMMIFSQAYGVRLPNLNLNLFVIGTAIFLAVGFLLGSWFFLKEAEKRVADYDRTRHWRDEPRRPIRRIRDAIPVD